MDFGDAISDLEWFVWNFGELWQLTGWLLCNKTKPNLVNLLSTQYFFEFRNGQLMSDRKYGLSLAQQHI